MLGHCLFNQYIYLPFLFFSLSYLLGRVVVLPSLMPIFPLSMMPVQVGQVFWDMFCLPLCVFGCRVSVSLDNKDCFISSRYKSDKSIHCVLLYVFGSPLECRVCSLSLALRFPCWDRFLDLQWQIFSPFRLPNSSGQSRECLRLHPHRVEGNFLFLPRFFTVP